jgi:hypothetical protein
MYLNVAALLQEVQNTNPSFLVIKWQTVRNAYLSLVKTLCLRTFIKHGHALINVLRQTSSTSGGRSSIHLCLGVYQSYGTMFCHCTIHTSLRGEHRTSLGHYIRLQNTTVLTTKLTYGPHHERSGKILRCVLLTWRMTCLLVSWKPNIYTPNEPTKSPSKDVP